jgi:hypothetical protein
MNTRILIAATAFLASAAGAQDMAPATSTSNTATQVITTPRPAPPVATTTTRDTTQTTVTKPVPDKTTTHQSSTTTHRASDGVYYKNGHWMKGNRYATSAQIAAHKNGSTTSATTSVSTSK